MGGLGPMLGQAGHFKRAAPEKIPYAIERYTNESKRLFGVLDKQLADKEFITGKYTIADMMSYPWTLAAPWLEIPVDDFPNVVRWQATMAAGPGVQRGMALLKDRQAPPPEKMDEKTREILYGKKQFEKR